MDRNQYPYRDRDRFQTPDRSGQVVNPYDQDSRLFQDLKQRGILPTLRQTIDVSTAGELFINTSGYHFCGYGRDSDNAVDTTVFFDAYINQSSDAGGTSAAFPARHARGFSGPFACLFLKWSAQDNGGQARYVDIVIFKNADQPWIDGEAST